jgi:hypothetical protein
MHLPSLLCLRNLQLGFNGVAWARNPVALVELSRVGFEQSSRLTRALALYRPPPPVLNAVSKKLKFTELFDCWRI